MKTQVRYLIARPIFQLLWQKLLNLATMGMNIGGGGNFLKSGEIWVIEWLNKTMANNSQIVFFYVGAHQGNYASMVLEKIGNKVKLFCFEPSPSSFEALQNRLGKIENVQLFNLGLSDQEGEVTLYATGRKIASLYKQHLHGENLENYQEEKIKLVTLEKFCQAEKIHQIDFLKLDVEGHELKILDGAKEKIKSQQISLIQFEFGETNISSRTYFRDYFELLHPYYNIYRILPQGLALINQENEGEFFRVTNYLAVSRKLAI
ncbi:MAG: FkbM family methyltransferase [Gomphosphaeria aponina SAG 52.96 = DSM 107014]|uniref:FkbM family methyltransferase n=1 Tax=Gomphosphaeria aponina SAG 52.96 = DSM 107014 TaxID=1521640 RepID=A0A941GWP7_9CHRO|nr:FkbM family methyltransferase [Gomphosphaeria aponina SAG 52.96 = DSM 107014]